LIGKRGISLTDVAGGRRWTAFGRSAGLRLVLLLLLELEEDTLRWRCAAFSERLGDCDFDAAFWWRPLHDFRRPLSLGVRLRVATGLGSRHLRTGELDRDRDRPGEEYRE
jgi:hypothetical protein